MSRLPALAKEAGHPFDAFQLLRFGDAALEWMTTNAAAEPDSQIRFAFDPAKQVITARVLGPEEGTLLPQRVVHALSLPVQGADTGVEAMQTGNKAARESGMRATEGISEDEF